MAGVNKLEHGIARPVFDRIGQQLQQQSQPQMPMSRGNEVGPSEMALRMAAGDR
jgi:hypothetical protein